MGVTLKQLAQEAGVSLATVSLALNGSRNVAQNTRNRILSLARRHNYQPNLVARSLAGGSNRLIGVLIDSRAPRAQFRLLAYIEKEAAQHGYRVMIGEAHDNVEHLHEIYDTFRQYSADGTICLAHDYPEQEVRFRELFGESPNMVFVGKPRLPHASYVEIDRSDAVSAAVRHLHQTGFRRIGMLCSIREYCSVTKRIAAFLKAQEELGIREPERLICRLPGEDPEEQHERLYREWIHSGKVDSLLFESDSRAASVCKFLKKKGISIPNEFGIVGSDNEDVCDYCSPELTSIDDAQELQATYAIRMLLNMLNDKNNARIDRSVTVKSRLIIRESSRKCLFEAGNIVQQNRIVC